MPQAYEQQLLGENEIAACVNSFAKIMNEAYNEPIASRWLTLADEFIVHTKLENLELYNFWQVQRSFLGYAEPILTLEFFPRL